MRPRPISRAIALVLAAVAVLLGLGSMAPRAYAQNIDLPEELRTVRDVRFVGLKALHAKQLKAAKLRTHKPSILPWRDKPTLRRDYLAADSAAIVSLYHHYGYLDARVRVLLEAGADAHVARVVFTIREGPLSRVDSLSFSGVTAYDERDLRKAVLAQPGRAFDPAFVPLDTLRIFSLYQERGYFVRTLATVRRDSALATRVRVNYTIDEGPPYRVGVVDYSAVGDVRESLARRELLMKPGQIFRRTRLDESIERLYKTTLYRQVQVTPLPDSARQTIDFQMRVIERKPRWVDVGVGSSATDRIKLDAAWGNRNLDSHALQGVLDGSLAYYADKALHFREGRNDATLTKPWLLGYRLTGQVGVFYQKLDDRSNDSSYVQFSDTRGLTFLLYKELSRSARVTLVEENSLVHQAFGLIGAFNAQIRDSLANAVLPRYRTNALRMTFEGDLRDNKVLPTRGSYHQVTGELSGGVLQGQASFNKGSFSSTRYMPLKNGWNLAVRVSGGVISPTGNVPSTFAPVVGTDPQVARVPRQSLFFIGGVNSLRGWGESSVTATGGLAMALANIEMRVPLIGPFGVEAFLDAGNVWSRPEYIRAHDLVWPWQATRANEGDLRYTYGIGGRFLLPFGPLRVDLAWSDRPDFPRPSRPHLPFVYQFAIGPSF